MEDDFVEYEECLEVGISLPYSVRAHRKVEISEGRDTAAVCIKDNDRKSLTVLILILYNYICLYHFVLTVQTYNGSTLLQTPRDKLNRFFHFKQLE